MRKRCTQQPPSNCWLQQPHLIVACLMSVAQALDAIAKKKGMDPTLLRTSIVVVGKPVVGGTVGKAPSLSPSKKGKKGEVSNR